MCKCVLPPGDNPIAVNKYIKHSDWVQVGFLLGSRHGEEVCFSGTLAKLRKATISFVKPVRQSAWNNSDPTEQISIKFDFFFEKFVEKLKFR